MGRQVALEHRTVGDPGPDLAQMVYVVPEFDEPFDQMSSGQCRRLHRARAPQKRLQVGGARQHRPKMGVVGVLARHEEPAGSLIEALTGYEGVVSAYLFGSEAEGRAHQESDVDVGVPLMAPRPVFLSGGNDPQKNPDGTIATSVNDQGQTVVVQAFDAWVDPKGSFMAAVGAAPVYELLGKKGLGVKDFPPVDTKVITGDIGFHQHPGGHTSGPAWETFYTFAARHLKK